jgi:hypothetical protein
MSLFCLLSPLYTLYKVIKIMENIYDAKDDKKI